VLPQIDGGTREWNPQRSYKEITGVDLVTSKGQSYWAVLISVKDHTLSNFFQLGCLVGSHILISVN
jgi:hypothetical protein